MNTGDFIQAIAAAAKAQMKVTRILASLTMAQALLESNRGESELAQEPNFNLFGIKGTGTAGSVTLPTKEWDGTKMITVNAEFRRYNSWEESIADHNSLFTRLQRYANLIGEKDYRRACVLVQKDGYATDPEYANKLISIIETYGLAAYDQETVVEQSIPDWAVEARSDLINLGISDGSRPHDPTLRIEAWTMLHNAIKLLDGRIPEKVAQAIAEIPKPEIPTDPPSWAIESIGELRSLGIMDGSRPNHYATRAEVAVMIERSIALYYTEIAEAFERITTIENQLEEKGLIGKLTDLILKPFKGDKA